MKAKKSYGQHFLNNESIARRIADSLISNGRFDTVLEVGPGKGMLTKYLLEKNYQLLVVEADPDMVLYLNKHFPELKERIVQANFLRVPLDRLISGQFALIGNFPYNISSQILIKMIEHRRSIPEMVGMFQREVADRVVAGPGSKTYGVISVLVQAFYEGEFLFGVEKGSFTPPPKVRSGVIRLRRKADQELGCDEKLFRTIVKQTFGQRRKMLRNTLKSMLPDHPVLKDDFFNQRPERLSVADFVYLTRLVEESR